MLEQLKEIKEKLNQLIQEVERLENAVLSDEVILEKKDFKFIKRFGTRYNKNELHVFQYSESIFFQLYGLEGSLIDDYKYENLIFKSLIEMEKIIVTNDGYTLTHFLEKELDTKLRDAYRNR